MTIAAGLPHLHGLTLCADTELTAGDLKLQAPKNARVECPFGRVGMVFAGHFSNATVTMHKIARALTKLDPAEHPLQAIESVLDTEYPRIVWSNPERYTMNLDFWLIFAIQPTGGQPELYVSEEVTVRASQTAVCAGTGAVVARPIIESAGSAFATPESTAVLATYMLSNAKRHASGVGGKSHIMDFADDGSFSEFIDDPYLKKLEDYFDVYQKQAWNLALTMTAPYVSDEMFEESLGEFNQRVINQRQEWAYARAEHQRHRDMFRSMTRPRAK
jgi:20S proteasome alpha/beta subunit